MSSEISRRIQDIECHGLESAASILVHEPGAAAAARRLLPPCGDRIVPVRQPFPAEQFNSRLDPAEVKARFKIGPVDPTILFVGDFDERHGPDILMKSVPAVLKNHKQARFVFVGDGALLWTLRVYSRYLSLDYVVRLAGNLAGQALHELLAAADIVAVPSRERTEYWQILAAWAAGRAVLASHNVGAPLIEHERTGVLVYPHESSCVWGLERLLFDHALRNWAGVNGRNKLLAQFGPACPARQLEELMGVKL
jgi:glycosyltransferase involved in cell wall biosynthesis